MGVHLLVIALGATLGLGLYHGFRGGLIRSAFKLLGLVAGLLLARPAAVWVAPRLPGALDFAGSWILLVLVCFVAITLVFALAGWLLSQALRWTPLVWVDKLGGAALGLFMGLIVAGALLALLDSLGIVQELASQATGWEASFLETLLAVTPDLFDTLRHVIAPGGVPRGVV
jgi:uncharacterized membrane protein required for colicin V production